MAIAAVTGIVVRGPTAARATVDVKVVVTAAAVTPDAYVIGIPSARKLALPSVRSCHPATG